MDKIFENWRNFRKKTLLQEKGVAPPRTKLILKTATKEAAKEAAKQGATRSILGLVLSRAGGILGLFWPSELADATLSPEHREAQERIARETAKKVQQSPQTVKDVIKNTDIIEFPGPKPEIIPGPWKDQPKKLPPKPDDVPEWFWDMVTRNSKEEEQNIDKKEQCKDRIRNQITRSSKFKAADRVLEELMNKHSPDCDAEILTLAEKMLSGSGIEINNNLIEARKEIEKQLKEREKKLEEALDECKFALPNFNPNYIPTVNADIMCQLLCKMLESDAYFAFLPKKIEFGSSKCWGIKQTIRKMLSARNCNCSKPKKNKKAFKDPTNPTNVSPLFK
jgi:hypothetical protein